MRAWYDIKGLDRKAAEDVAGFRDADAQIRRLIAREVERGIPANRIVLAGFSQGAAVSLYTAVRLPEGLAGVMALSSYFPRESSFSAERAPANNSTPIFMAHGQGDTVLPLAHSRIPVPRAVLRHRRDIEAQRMGDSPGNGG